MSKVTHVLLGGLLFFYFLNPPINLVTGCQMNEISQASQ